ncbi:MAG: SPOR domain-containing protein [Armatimonadetes bacterium]|nr:SPOR domain-containing protein [Armatimonadota bacterium]MDE2205068.1 SPOR domain-containing protein [Armatimonadota bacterium]
MQLGVFSTTAAAQQTVAAASAKGLKTYIEPFTRRGRLLYRVQYAAYGSRRRADREKQRLSSQGIDTWVANP